MEQYIRNRLEYVEETFAGEMETWVDPVTATYYKLPIEIHRDWDNIQPISNTWHGNSTFRTVSTYSSRLPTRA